MAPVDAFDRAIDLIDGATSLALACHVHPDGDALGSALAMHLLCRAHGKASVVSWPEPFRVGPHYRFLPGLDLAIEPAAFPAVPEVMLTFDLGSYERLGSLAPSARRAQQLVVLDHHDDNERFGSVNVVWTAAASTTVVVRELARRLGWELDHDIALNLYVGLVTDTGRFRHPNTTDEVYALADELAAFALPIDEIGRELFDEHRQPYYDLADEVIARAVLDPDVRFIASWTTLDDLDRHGLEFDETEGLIDQLGRVASNAVVCLVKEAPGEGRRVSLRSDGGFDVAAVAASFGGGGHPFMAGFTTDDPIGEIIDAVRAASVG